MLAGNPEPVKRHRDDYWRWLPNHCFHLFSGRCLKRRDHPGRVGYFSPIDWTGTIGIGGDKVRTTPDCLKTDVQLLIIKRAIECSDDVLNLAGVIAKGKTSLFQFRQQRGLSDCVHPRSGITIGKVAGEDI